MMFEWLNYSFMINALAASLIAAPIFAILGTLVISNRMAFYTDVIGHSTLTGIAIGVLLGISDPVWSMAVFLVLLAVGINYFKTKTKASADTVLGVFFAFVVALGIVILSRNGGFAKYTSYLIGDVLTVSRAELYILAVLLVVTVVYWLIVANPLYLMSINRSLAKTRKANVFWLETSFTILLGLVVAFSIKLVGILIINSLIILPAAAARVLSKDLKSYTFYSVGISLVSSVLGIISSFYLGTASGGTIVLFAAAIYVISVIYKRHLSK